MGVARRDARAEARWALPRLPQRPGHRGPDHARPRDLARALRSRARPRPGPFVRRRQGRRRGPGGVVRRGRGAVRRAHRRAAGDGPARPVPHLAGDRGRRLARRGRPAARNRLRGDGDARLEAAARRRARVRLRREDRPARQAGPRPGRLRLRDVEQRHVRLRRRHRPHLRLGALLHGHARRTRPRLLPRQHLSRQLQRRQGGPEPALVRCRRRGAELLLHRRPHAEAGRVALHGADGTHAPAAAMGPRLSPVPLQLLPRVQGALHRRELPPAPDPRRRDLARHPLRGGLQPLHLGPRAVPGSPAHDQGPARPGIPAGDDRGSAPQEAEGLVGLRHRPRARRLRQEPRRLRARGAGLAVERGEGPRSQRVPRFHEAGGPRLVGRAHEVLHRRRRRRDLERHERAGGFRRPDPHHGPRRAPRQRGPAHGRARDPQRVRDAEQPGDLRGARPPAPRRAPVRPHARHVRRRPALRGALAGRQRQQLGPPAGDDSHVRQPRPVGLLVRRRRHRGLRGSADGRAVHPLAAARRLLSLHAHPHDLRHAGPGALELRHVPRGAQPPRHRDAVRAAARGLQRDGGGEPDRDPRLPAAPPRVSGRPRDLGARRRVPVRLRPAGGAGAP